ncbi:MAG: 2-C-methyl-D-erythritol 4-phosphate cytidylyltransferase [Deltaproteobacteria bacterium]|nr:2-C-methyl-D-erythritol 4-phosphate cytidylyltransferase [Deltaproteobacteria bacterium]
MRATAVLLAAGSGTRFGSAVPKQYILLGGRAILEHALRRFEQANSIDQIVLVVAPELVAGTRERYQQTHQKLRHVVGGGARRQDSMAAGLAVLAPLDERTIIAVHDVARPLIRPALIDECVRIAAVRGGCIVGMPAQDTVKAVNAEGLIERTVPRETVWLAQTPQAFSLGVLRRAVEHAQRAALTVTDEAAMVEAIGEPVAVVRGDVSNLKITTPADLLMAEAVLSQEESGCA